ncbi:ProQ/FINO family protein [Methylobacterium fujisawaense]|jgi:ProP effector|uniref:ProQ/FINO family protein n=1 Tax=Methylobacterium fujisawaense TaxID=107400 RepID=UPI000FDF28DB
MTNASVPAAAQVAEQPAKITPNGNAVVATRYEIDKLTALCALLTEHPVVFPAAIGRPVLPLAIGILDALKPLLRPEATAAQLKDALRTYSMSLAYLLAQSRSGSWRHDLAGVPVAPVSEEHRSSAWDRFTALRARRNQLRQARRSKIEPAAIGGQAKGGTEASSEVVKPAMAGAR